MRAESSARVGGASAPAALALPARERAIIVSAVLLLAALAWSYMLYDYWRMHTLPMSEMWMPPTGDLHWSAADFGFTFVMWAVMMVAMMAPTAIPMITMYRLVVGKQCAEDAHVRTGLFLLGYLVAWSGYSVFATLVQWALHGHELLTPMMDNDSGRLAGSVLIVCGLYQCTPWKDRCLSKCRTPLGFLLGAWREGRLGALSMGLKHGLFCVGCCWALMLVLFAVGVMNMIWVAVITGLVLAEKLLPFPARAISAASGCLFLGWGAWFLISPIVLS